MKKTGFSLLLLLAVALLQPTTLFSAETPASDNLSGLQQAEIYANELWARQHGRAPQKKRWSIFGRAGYVYDDNAALISDHKAFVTGSPSDESAGRYFIDNTLTYDVYRAERNQIQAGYSFYQSFHDDGLNEFNFQNHEAVLRGTHKLNTARASEVSLEYAYAHGMLDEQSYSSFNTWTARWRGSWSDRLPVEFYQKAAARNYRDKGFRPSDTSRDGYYSRTGFIQGYKIKPVKALVYGGYEFGFDATEGDNFDNVANGFLLGWRSPLVEKVNLDLNASLHDAYYGHYAGGINRNDLKTQYEVRLGRPFGQHFELQLFYRRVDVNASHDGTLGFFNYDRNLYGAEWHYRV